MIEKIESEQHWQAALVQVAEYDFYHNWEYHALEGERLGADPLMLAYREGSETVLLPMLVRSIEGSHYRDATSVYGYSGLLTSAGAEPRLLGAAVEAFQEAMSDQGIVTLFTRLHPISDAGRELPVGEVLTLGRTVSVDLSLPDEEQFALYASGHRYDVRKLIRDGYTCRFSQSDDDIELFHQIYLQTMARLSASEEYLFSLDYLARIIKSEQLDVRIVVCELEGDVAAAATFSYQEPFIQGHLAGNTDAHLKRSPMKLIYDVVRREGTAEGYRCLHLGGGVGGKLDSLYKYKRDFSRTEHDFKVWRWVIDPSAYAELCGQRGVEPHDAFFPAYRAPAKPAESGIHIPQRAKGE